MEGWRKRERGKCECRKNKTLTALKRALTTDSRSYRREGRRLVSALRTFLAAGRGHFWLG